MPNHIQVNPKYPEIKIGTLKDIKYNTKTRFIRRRKKPTSQNQRIEHEAQSPCRKNDARREAKNEGYILSASQLV